jgi:hypothetical protein
MFDRHIHYWHVFEGPLITQDHQAPTPYRTGRDDNSATPDGHEMTFECLALTGGVVSSVAENQILQVRRFL